jgi:hypothetical protein
MVNSLCPDNFGKNTRHSYAKIASKESIRQFHYQNQPVDVTSSALTIVRR